MVFWIMLFLLMVFWIVLFLTDGFSSYFPNPTYLNSKTLWILNWELKSWFLYNNSSFTTNIQNWIPKIEMLLEWFCLSMSICRHVCMSLPLSLFVSLSLMHVCNCIHTKKVFSNIRSFSLFVSLSECLSRPFWILQIQKTESIDETNKNDNVLMKLFHSHLLQQRSC